MHKRREAVKVTRQGEGNLIESDSCVSIFKLSGNDNY